MVKWEALNRPKDFGGLGFTDVRVMNTCLVAKWFARLEANDLSICCELLRKKISGQQKYLPDKEDLWVAVLERLALDKTVVPVG